MEDVNVDVENDPANQETNNGWREKDEDTHNSTVEAENSDSELPPTPGKSPRPFNLRELSSTLPADVQEEITPVREKGTDTTNRHQLRMGGQKRKRVDRWTDGQNLKESRVRDEKRNYNKNSL